MSQNRNMFKRVAVFGVGLLGGSLCKGLKKLNPDIHIAAYGRDSARLETVIRDRYADEARGYDEISLVGVDLIVVAAPVQASVGIIRRILDDRELRDDAVVTDVGSVKEKIIASVLECRRAPQFVGCHPMAGSEKAGYEFSSGSLFEGASVIITPHHYNREAEIARIRELWEMLGAYTFIVSPEMHDTYVSYTSHLPHVVASSLISLLDDFSRDRPPSTGIGPFVGRGFLDMTRISSGSPEMWRDIVVYNRTNIIDAISRLIEKLNRLRDAMFDADSESRFLHDYFQHVKNVRDTLG
jgi:prephenate dehydrogenase